MFKRNWTRFLALCLAFACLVGAVGAANLAFDYNQDGKTTVWDAQQAPEAEQSAALEEALGGRDELHKNAEGKYEIWTSLGVYNMANRAQEGETFVLMQDVDMNGAWWQPVENFNGKLEGNVHTISNFKITEQVDGNVGFFANIAKEGSVEWLNLADINIILPERADTVGLLAAENEGYIYASTVIGFVTDYRTTLPADLVVGGLVGKQLATGRIETHVENMLPADKSSEIPNITAKLGMNFASLSNDTYERSVAIVGQNQGFVDPMTLLQNATGLIPDPNAIAWVENGDVITYPHTVEEILSQIAADGNTVITLVTDISNKTAINLPYSCTIDFNGYSIATNPSSGNGFNILAIGTDNFVTTVKNGKMLYHTLGIRVNHGAIVVSNMEMVGFSGAAVGLYDATAYGQYNLIEDSTLSSGSWGCLTYNAANLDMTATGITIERSKLISHGSNQYIFEKNSGTKPGFIRIGTDVELYTYAESFCPYDTLEGLGPVKLEETADVMVNGKLYTGLNHWTTDQSIIATEVIAEVTNGDQTIQVTNTKDIANSVKADGNTYIKLITDINNSAQFSLPYTCTVDLNGYSITNSAGNSLRFCAVGTENTVATVKNGTINHAVLAIRMDTGSLDVSNVTFNNLGSGSTIAFYDPNPVYRANNKIDNCYIYNAKYFAITFAVGETDFSGTGITITNSTLICPNSYVFGRASDATPGVITLGEHVEIFSKNKAIANTYRYSGLMAGRTDNVTVTIKGTDTTYTLNNWSTDKQTETINVLLLGNSLSTTIPEELYQVAHAAGIELAVTDLYHAGAYGWQHKNWITNDMEEYEYRVYNDMGFWFHGDIKTVDDAIDYLEWDHVSYQEWLTATYAKTYDSALANYEQYNDWIYDYLKSRIPNAKFYCYQHWSWQVGHASVPNVETQTRLFNVIRDVTTYFSEKYEATLIPCGEAWQLARADALIGDTLCKADNLHDDGPTGGQYLNGCVFFETMFQRSCIGDTWRASTGPSEEKHIALQQHAHNAVAAIHGENYAK